MRIIRENTFETNSSSTHALVIPKKVEENDYTLYDSLDHDYYFGRGESRLVDSWDEKFAYAYMILKTTMEWGNNTTWKPKHKITKEDLENFVGIVNSIFYQIIDVLGQNEPNFTPNDLVKYLESDREDGNITGKDSFYILMERNGNYVDHANGLDDTDFIDRLLNDIEFVRKFIFNKASYITIGGDEYRGYNIKTIGFEYDYSGHYYVNSKGEKPPKEWFDEDGRIKDKYWDKYYEEYNIDAGGFWDKLKEYEKDNDVYLKGN